MKLRLTAISEEDLSAAPASAGSLVEYPATGKIIVARLTPPGQPPYYGLGIPYEMIQGAQVGDEFTLHLERADDFRL